MTGPSEERSAERAAQKGIRSAMTGIVVNALLALVKGIAGFIGNSYALIADAIESASDVVSSLIVVSGLRIAAKPRDENHPYGHGKAEPIAAVIVALSLFGAALTIITQSYHEIVTPHHAPAPFTLIVLIIVVLTKEALFRSVFRVAEEVQSTAVRTDAWHHRSDAITSAAAFIGISLALIGGDGFESADDWAALFASVIIIYNAYALFRPALDEIMDAAPPADMIAQVRAAAGAVPGVLGLDKCYVRKMGLEYFVDLHVIVNGTSTVREGHRIGHDVKDAVCRALPRIADVMVHVEPDSFE